MPGPAPTYRPTFTPDEVAACERLLRRPTAPQAQVQRARLALLLHAQPDLDTAAAGRRLGKHANWVFRWRRTWAREGFRLTDRPGRGRKPALSPCRWRPSRRWPASCRRSVTRRSAATAPATSCAISSPSRRPRR